MRCKVLVLDLPTAINYNTIKRTTHDDGQKKEMNDMTIFIAIVDLNKVFARYS